MYDKLTHYTTDMVKSKPMGHIRNLYKKWMSLELLYAFIAFIWGIILVFLIPPFQTPDEPAHYYRAVGISNGHYICKEGNRLEIPLENSYFVNAMDTYTILSYPDRKFSIENIKKYQDSGNKESKLVHMPLCYSLSIPHHIIAVPLKLGTFINFNLLQSFYLARLTNLIMAIIVTTIAMHIIPFGKRIIFTLGILPMTIHQYASLNYDAFFIPMIFLFIAYTLYLYKKDHPLTMKNKVILLCLSIFGTIVKLGYQPLLIIPSILLFRKKEKIKKTVLFLILVWVINIILLVMQQKLLVNYDDYQKGVDPSEQIHSILTHPFTYLITIIRTLYYRLGYYVQSYLGYFGWLDYKLKAIYYYLIPIGSIVFIWLDKKRVTLPFKVRLIFILAFFITTLCIFTSMYVVNTIVDNNIIIGVQGRYLIGISLAAALGIHYLPDNKIIKKYRHIISASLLLLLLIIIVQTIRATYIRYYAY